MEKIKNDQLFALFFVRDPLKQNTAETKSLDFYDKNTNTYFYAKFINENGGAQDNQFRDIKNFIEIANKISTLSNCYKFCAVISGEYLKKKNGKIKIKTLRNYYNILGTCHRNEMVYHRQSSSYKRILLYF